MRYYIDTEFIESQNYLELISIGIKCEDGRTFYAESNEVDFAKANDWVKENVIPGLIFKDFPNNYKESLHSTFEIYGSKNEIASEIKHFIGDDIPIFYGYYADYDWVLFCWLFGAMIYLPPGWPMYCRDLKQMLDETGIEKMADPTDEHNALADAIWNEELHKHIKKEAIRLCGVRLGS